MSNTIPTLPDHLFEDASRGTAMGVDRTEQWRQNYEDDVRQLAELDHVTQGEVERYSQVWAAYLVARSGCISAAVAGPSNFPTRKARRASDAADKRMAELTELRRQIERSAKIRGKRAAIEAAGGQDAVDRRRLDELRRYLDVIREANRIVRSKPRNERTDEKVEKLAALSGISETDAEMLFVPDGGHYGFPPHTRASTQGKIKRLEEKLKAKPVEVAPPPDDDTFRFEEIGATVTLAHADDRLRIAFDGKPPLAMRERLKTIGRLRWARSSQTWQRKLTAQGMLSWSAISSVGAALEVDLFAMVRELRRP
jgi:hypothetical protein